MSLLYIVLNKRQIFSACVKEESVNNISIYREIIYEPDTWMSFRFKLHTWHSRLKAKQCYVCLDLSRFYISLIWFEIHIGLLSSGSSKKYMYTVNIMLQWAKTCTLVLHKHLPGIRASRIFMPCCTSWLLCTKFKSCVPAWNFITCRTSSE